MLQDVLRIALVLAVGSAGPQLDLVHAQEQIVPWGSDDEGVISDTPLGHGFMFVAVGALHCLALNAGGDSGAPNCFGDGSGTACPCSANGNPGEGCRNSSGAHGVRLTGFGGASLSSDAFRLVVSGAIYNRPGLILRGANPVNGGLGTPIGDGLLCTGGQTARSHVPLTNFNGTLTFIDFKGSPFGARSLGPGVPTNHQFWYRDPANTCTGSGFNFSNAWAVYWTP